MGEIKDAACSSRNHVACARSAARAQAAAREARRAMTPARAEERVGVGGGGGAKHCICEGWVCARKRMPISEQNGK